MPPRQQQQQHQYYKSIDIVNFPRNHDMISEKDVEYIEPPFDSPLRKTAFFSATFNLIATIVGGGVLSLPLAFSKAGIIVAMALMIFAAIITDFSLYILCSCARRTNPGSTSYMEIVRYAFGPRAEMATTSILVTYLSGVLVGFCVLLKGIFAPLIKDFMNVMGGSLGAIQETDQFDAIVLFIILIFMSPLMVQRDLYALRNICYVGFSSVCLIAVTIGIRAYQRNFEDEERPENINFQIQWMPFSWDNVFFAFPVIVLAFLCAFNMVEVHTALLTPTRARVNSVIHVSVISCFFLFVAFGLVGYFYAYNTVLGNIFLNFEPSDKLILVGRLGMGLTLIGGMPMSLLPCREALFSLLAQIDSHRSNNELVVLLEEDSMEIQIPVKFGHEKSINECKSLLSPSATSLDYSTLDENTNKLDRQETRSTVMEMDLESYVTSVNDNSKEMRSVHAHFIVTLAFATFGYIGAVYVPGVEYVWRILGSSMGMIIAFIVPALCYLKIRGHKGISKTTVGAFFLLVFSFVAAIICTIKAISS